MSDDADYEAEYEYFANLAASDPDFVLHLSQADRERFAKLANSGYLEWHAQRFAGGDAEKAAILEFLIVWNVFSNPAAVIKRGDFEWARDRICELLGKITLKTTPSPATLRRMIEDVMHEIPLDDWPPGLTWEARRSGAVNLLAPVMTLFLASHAEETERPQQSIDDPAEIERHAVFAMIVGDVSRIIDVVIHRPACNRFGHEIDGGGFNAITVADAYARAENESRCVPNPSDSARSVSRENYLRTLRTAEPSGDTPTLPIVLLDPPQITIDGTLHPLTNEQALYLYELINVGDWLSDPEFKRRCSLVGESAKPHRWRDRLPKAVKTHLETHRSKGTRWLA